MIKECGCDLPIRPIASVRPSLLPLFHLVVVVGIVPTLPVAANPQKPNIVWVMAEDIGCDLGCYGTPAVQTPVLDQMAADGLRLTRAYVTGPICSTARSAMMTGVYQEAIDAHHHRSHRNDGYRLPSPVRPITHLLRNAGYFCAIGCGYGSKTDLNFKTRGKGQPKLFDGNDWSKRAEDQPFFAHIQLRVTHRGDWWESVRKESDDPVDPNSVSLPPYLPDHPTVRQDWALYLDQLEKADRQMGQILTRLENEGLFDNTLVIFMGDNGRCHIRGKGFLYEDGIRVPAIVRWPSRMNGGETWDGLVSSIDITAQVLAAAGVELPNHLHGLPFLEAASKPRDAVFASRDRWDEVLDKSRCVVTDKYKYIRNDMPEVRWDADHDYVERNRPMLSVLRELYQQDRLTSLQARFFEPRKPSEELYNLDADPYELNNLADDPASRTVLNDMRDRMQTWEQSIRADREKWGLQ